MFAECIATDAFTVLLSLHFKFENKSKKNSYNAGVLSVYFYLLYNTLNAFSPYQLYSRSKRINDLVLFFYSYGML